MPEFRIISNKEYKGGCVLEDQEHFLSCIVCEDTILAQHALLKCGKLLALQELHRKNIQITEARSGKKVGCKSFLFFGTIHHFCVASMFTGYTEEEGGNGYLLHALPRSSFSPELATRMLRDAIKCDTAEYEDMDIDMDAISKPGVN